MTILKNLVFEFYANWLSHIKILFHFSVCIKYSERQNPNHVIVRCSDGIGPDPFGPIFSALRRYRPATS